MTPWIDPTDQSSIPAVNTSDLPVEIKMLIKSDCIVRIPPGTTGASVVNLTHYSLIVDLEQLMFNMTITIGLINGTEKDEIGILVHHSREDGTFDYMSATRSKSLKHPCLMRSYITF